MPIFQTFAAQCDYCAAAFPLPEPELRHRHVFDALQAVGWVPEPVCYCRHLKSEHGDGAELVLFDEPDDMLCRSCAPTTCNFDADSYRTPICCPQCQDSRKFYEKPCPRCEAPAGEPCHTVSHSTPMRVPHSARQLGNSSI